MTSKYKVIFTGPVGAGKTTAIAAISDKPPVSTNELASDMTVSRKAKTTVAMDYGIKYLDNGDILHLYGTPGQQRFDFMWEILVENGLGLMLLIDNRRDNPLADLAFYLKAFKAFIAKAGVAVGVVGMDVKAKPLLGQYQQTLKTLGYATVPVFQVDARSKRDVSIMLEALLYSISGKLEA